MEGKGAGVYECRAALGLPCPEAPGRTPWVGQVGSGVGAGLKAQSSKLKDGTGELPEGEGLIVESCNRLEGRRGDGRVSRGWRGNGQWKIDNG